MKNSAIPLLAILFLQSIGSIAQSAIHSTSSRCEALFSPEARGNNSNRSVGVLLQSENISVTKIDVQYTDREVFNPYVREVITDPDVVKQAETRQLEQLSSAIKTAQSVQNEVSKLPQAGTVDTVLYMASGFDGASPFLAFNSARTVFAVDQHPFVKDPTLPIRLRVPENDHDGYALIGAVNDQAQSLASTILWRLSQSIQNFRLIRVVAFTEPTPTAVGRPAQHGLIEFDSGPGTQVRRYIHIDANIGSEYRPGQQPWWLARILNHGINGLLVKGAMSVYANASKTDVASPARDVTRYLMKNGGIIVDGDSTPTWPWKAPAPYPK
ncbi:MAG: hypothetical protein IPJ84_08680 [Bdellovibrionales bacterium]|nr:hypothetical protein [Bdellovibrionales bacterium]